MIREFPVDDIRGLSDVCQEGIYFQRYQTGQSQSVVYGTDGVDGLKTGHTESGYGLLLANGATSVIMVLNGMTSKKQRSSESRRLMDLIFREYRHYLLYEAGQVVDRANVWLGEDAHVDLVLKDRLDLVLSRAERRKMKVTLQWLDPLPAPLVKGDVVGKLVLDLPGKSSSYELLVAIRGGIRLTYWHGWRYLIFGAGADVLANIRLGDGGQMGYFISSIRAAANNTDPAAC